MRDIISNIKVQSVLPPQVVTAAKTAAVDRLGFDSLMFVVDVGASGDTLSGTVKFDFYLEHADDNGEGSAGAWAPVTNPFHAQGLAVDSSGKFATVDGATDDETTYRIGYVGDKRHVRVKEVAAGTHTNGTPMAISAILGNPASKPVSY